MHVTAKNCSSPSRAWKYIFHARDGEEQFFDLDGDPYELTDLSGDPRRESELRKWRQRLIEHFVERGEPFLRNGKLGLRPEGQRHSPHYPRSAPRAGSKG